MKYPIQYIICFSLGCFVPFFIFSQKDTTYAYQPVTIKGQHFELNKYNTLSTKEIRHINSEDLGELLQYINGITIKNYGGIGGLKTISHRGLGGEHTQVIINGTPISNAQTGQLNFAEIPANNLEEVKLLNNSSKHLLPVNALVKGSAIQITTFNQSFSSHPFSLRSTLNLGSFGLQEGFLALKNGGKHHFVGISGNYRSYKGNYPYLLPYGNPSTSYLRRNNAMTDYSMQLDVGFKWKSKKSHHQLKGFGSLYNIQQELPGAVVLYNNMAATTLQTQRIRTGLTYQLNSNQFNLNTFLSYTRHFLHYHDPNYLNKQGYLDNLYTNNTLSGGFHGQYHWQSFSFHLGSTLRYDAMESNRSLGSPQRISGTSMAKIRFNQKYFYVDGSIFYQLFVDQNQSEKHQNRYHRWHPQVAIYTSDKLFTDFQFFAWFKPSSRAPSFNELYYSQVGNKSLVPEEATQLNLGTQFVKEWQHFTLHWKVDIFRNHVSNKILALPTKNLFVWSIQNIGEVAILGGDAQILTQFNWRKNWQLKIQVGGSYQRSVDMSNPEEPTYKNQIAYTPSLTGNALLGLQYKKIGLHLSGLFIGERYSLNENIPANYLAPYFIFNVSGNYTLNLGKRNTINIYAGIKNVANSSYNFIRYFIMPGRNYYLKLSYAFR